MGPLALRERGLQSLEACLRPNLLRVVILFKGVRPLGKLKPGHLVARINVDVRPQGARVVECSNAHESDLGAAAVVAPKRHLAFAAAIDVVRTIGAMNRHGFQVATEEPYGGGFDNRIEDKGAAGVSLAIGAVTAVHGHRGGEELVAHVAAGTTAAKFLSRSTGAPFHTRTFCG